MTDRNTAPERIGLLSDGLGLWALATVDEADIATHYLRADVAQAMVAAALEASVDVLRQRDSYIAPDKMEAYDRGWSRALKTAAPAIRALTPDNARAALEAAKAEAYRQGMLRAAEIAEHDAKGWSLAMSAPVLALAAAIRAEAETKTPAQS